MSKNKMSNIPSMFEIFGLTVNSLNDPNFDVMLKEAYKKLVFKNHPDKGGDEEVFQLIQDAFDILSSPDKRQVYMKTLGVNRNKDYHGLKQGFDEYRSTIDNNPEFILSDTEKKRIESSFREDLTDPIKQDEAKQYLYDLKKKRALQDATCAPKQYFSEETYTPDKFNAFFDKYHKKTDAIAARSIPMGYNEVGLNGSQYSSFLDASNDVVYYNQMFSEFDELGYVPDFDDSEINNLEGASYHTKHSEISKDDRKKMVERLRQREAETRELMTTPVFKVGRDTGDHYDATDLIEDAQTDEVVDRFNKIQFAGRFKN